MNKIKFMFEDRTQVFISTRKDEQNFTQKTLVPRKVKAYAICGERLF